MNKLIILLAFGFGLISCQTTSNIKQYSRVEKMRVTLYCAKEDKKYRNKIAASSKMRAQEGRTVAVDPRKIPYWSRVRIPFLDRFFHNGGVFTAEDTGKHVKSRKASNGKTNVIDVYVSSMSKMKRLAAIIPPYLDVEY